MDPNFASESNQISAGKSSNLQSHLSSFKIQSNPWAKFRTSGKLTEQYKILNFLCRKNEGQWYAEHANKINQRIETNPKFNESSLSRCNPIRKTKQNCMEERLTQIFLKKNTHTQTPIKESRINRLISWNLAQFFNEISIRTPIPKVRRILSQKNCYKIICFREQSGDNSRNSPTRKSNFLGRFQNKTKSYKLENQQKKP